MDLVGLAVAILAIALLLAMIVSNLKTIYNSVLTDNINFTTIFSWEYLL